MSIDQVTSFSTVSRVLPSANADNSQIANRASVRGEQYVQSLLGSKLHGLSDEGSYFIATNPTPGTGIAGIAATGGFSDAESLFMLRMADASTKRHYPDFLLLELTAAGTNGTTVEFAIKGDTGTTRYTSGGSAITPVNSCMRSTATSDATMYFGALVTTAASASARLLAHGKIRTVIGVAGDKYLFTFGNASPANVAGMILEGTAQAAIHVPCPPMSFGATDQLVMSIFAASQSAAQSFQFMYGGWER